MNKETKEQVELDYVIVRPYELKDRRQLIALLREAWDGSSPGLWRAYGYIIAENENKIVGAVHCWQQGERLKLEDLAVKPVHRRQGIAAALVSEAEQKAKEMGLRTITIEASSRDLANYYEKLGFTPIKLGSRRLTKYVQGDLT